MIETFKKTLLLVNSEGKSNIQEKVVQYFTKEFTDLIQNNQLLIRFTVDENTIKELSRDFSKKNENSLIIVVGGDGSLHEVVNSINLSNTSVSIIPNGSGNDFASHIYGSKSLEEILDEFKNPSFKKVDMIKINDILCINTTSFGYETTVLAKSLEIKKKWNFLRSLSFKLAIPLTIGKMDPINYRYEFNLSDGNVLTDEGSYILNAICNGSRFGGGFTPAPMAEIDDGIIEINQLEKVGLLGFIRKISDYKSGRHIDTLDISHNSRVISGSIIPKAPPLKGNIDGELYDFEKIDFEILPKSINIMYLDS